MLHGVDAQVGSRITGGQIVDPAVHDHTIAGLQPDGRPDFADDVERKPAPRQPRPDLGQEPAQALMVGRVVAPDHQQLPQYTALRVGVQRLRVRHQQHALGTEPADEGVGIGLADRQHAVEALQLLLFLLVGDGDGRALRTGTDALDIAVVLAGDKVRVQQRQHAGRHRLPHPRQAQELNDAGLLRPGAEEGGEGHQRIPHLAAHWQRQLMQPDARRQAVDQRVGVRLEGHRRHERQLDVQREVLHQRPDARAVARARAPEVDCGEHGHCGAQRGSGADWHSRCHQGAVAARSAARTRAAPAASPLRCNRRSMRAGISAPPDCSSQRRKRCSQPSLKKERACGLACM